MPWTIAGSSQEGGITEERVRLYHGSINDASAIRAQGLDAGRTPTWVSRDISAARNAIDPAIRVDRIRDPGVIESLIPRDEFDAVLAPNERAYTGFNGVLRDSSEIVLRTAEQVALFNKYIIRCSHMDTDGSYLEAIIHSVNCALPAEHIHLSSANTLFASDADVEYQGQTRRIRREKLVPPQQFQARLAPLLDGGPSWIHANLVPLRADQFLVTVATGARIGNPRPSINVSHELNRVAEIVT